MEKHWPLKLLDNIAKVLVIICGMAMLFTVLMGIFGRYVIHYSLPWTEELPRFLMVWMALFACPLAFDYGFHASFNALADKLGKRGRLINFIFTRVLIIAFLSVVVYKGFSLMSVFGFQMAPTLQISYAIPYSAVPLSASLFLLKYLLEFIHGVKKGFTKS
jgi:TRAP-type C4-dicarboxylate transport system permease small subunit